MRFFRVFGRSFRDAFKSVGRNFSLSIASISCITITLIIVAASLMISQNVEKIANNFKDDVSINVFIKEKTTKESVDALVKVIEKMENVETVVFKSKMDIKNEMEAVYQDYSVIMSGWTEETNPLQDTLQIKVKALEKISETAESIKKYEQVGTVKYGEGMVESLINLFKTIERIAYIMVISLVIVTVFLIINTIKLTIFSRKREISIMRLVGASNISIKTPFVIEGMILGIIGSIIPIILIIYGYFGIYNYFGGKLYSDIILLIAPEPFVYQISLIVLVLGALVGMIGSARAVGKYLKV